MRTSGDTFFDTPKRSGVAAVSVSLLLFAFISCGNNESASPLARSKPAAGRERQGVSCVKRVRSGVRGLQDGLGWTTAFDSIDKAVAAAQNELLQGENSPQCEVWVAKGTYFIFKKSRMDTLQLAENVHLYGGFKGDESKREQRDIEKFKTVIDGRDSAEDNDRVYHVITGANDAVLDGFTVTHGDAVRGRHGGAMYNDKVSPLIRNCVFVGNSSGWFGGAIFNNYNFARIFNCVFEKNTAKYGGAVMNQQTSGLISGSIFRNNEATEQGGAMYNHSRVATRIENSIFYKNEAKDSGGAVYNVFRADPVFVNCVFLENKDKKKKGSAVYNEFKCNPVIINSILWSNGKTPIYEDMKVSHSVVEHGYEGPGNSSEDPLIAERKGGTYALMPGSPCIDAADGFEAPPVDFSKKERIDISTVEDKCCCEPDTEMCDELLWVGHADIGAVEFEPKLKDVAPGPTD